MKFVVPTPVVRENQTAVPVAAPCRICGHDELWLILSLGHTPLANRLVDASELDSPEPTYPLEWCFCPKCSLAQISETVPPEILFRNYPYFSSYADSMVEHARQLASRLIFEQQLGPDSLVVEAASNDGYLLLSYVRAGIPVLGIEPAENIAAVANQKGIPTRPDFFGHQLALELAQAGIRADVFHAHNVLAHVADLNGFVAGISQILKPSGIGVVEVPYVREMVDKLEFDTIYHEHLCYFSLTSLYTLFAKHGLTITHVERVPIHGGSLRIFVRQRTSLLESDAESVGQLLADEWRSGVNSFDYYAPFADRVNSLGQQLLTLLHELKSAGKRLAAYGASAKGSTLLNYFGIGRNLLDYVVDRSPYKQGKFTPGMKLPILPPSRLLEDHPDYVLLLTWNFQEEIMAQQERYRQMGGKFIIPVPRVTVV